MKINNLNLLTQDELKELIERTYSTLELVSMDNSSMPNDVFDISKRGTDFESTINAS